MRTVNKLSNMKVASLAEPGRYGDGGGLWLQIGPTGGKAWVFRYMKEGRARHMGIGPLHTLSLKEARDRARRLRQFLLDGVDPLLAKRANDAETGKHVTFAESADKFIAAHETDWRNEKHRAQWRSTLASYADPVFGRLPVAQIDMPLVLRVLEPIWTAKPETAGRLRGRIERVLDWARVRGYRHGDNPARWRGHLDKLLPAQHKSKRVRHHPALAYVQMPAFTERLRDNSAISARALEFTILTAARTGEAIGATWAEIDFAAGLWTIPPGRMKAHREHRVPLCDRVLEILTSLPREEDNPHLFVGGRKGTGLSNMAMLQLLRGMDGGAGLTVHGFRSTFRDWAAETTAYANHVVEAALAHVVADKVEAAYRRGDMFDKRRRLMADWASYCGSPPAERGDVVPMRAGR
jgi:integrase